MNGCTNGVLKRERGLTKQGHPFGGGPVSIRCVIREACVLGRAFGIELGAQAAFVTRRGVFVQGRRSGGLVEGFVDALEFGFGLFDAAVQEGFLVGLDLGAESGFDPAVAGAAADVLFNAFLGG